MATTTTNPLAEFNGKLIDGLRFCAKVYRLFESIRKTTGGVSRLRMRPSRLEKRLLEELLPICKYMQASYRLGRYISVRWVDGNQGYDAQTFQRGAYVSQGYYPARGHLEVVTVMHQNEHLSRELLEEKGVVFGLNGLRRGKKGAIESLPVVRKGHDFIVSYSKLVLKQITKKATISYPDNTSLIVQCILDTLYAPDEWDLLIDYIRKALPKNLFREIYLYDPVLQHSHIVTGDVMTRGC